MSSYVVRLGNDKDEWEIFAGTNLKPLNTVDGRALDGAEYDNLLDIALVLDGEYRDPFPEGGERFYTLDLEGNLRICHICGSISFQRYTPF